MESELKRVQRVIVLGCGSAGFMAALALKKRMPDLSVTVIRSKDIGIIGVGEGSTTALTGFLHQYLQVPPKQFYEMAVPTWKLGLKFVWGPRPHFFYSFDSVHLTANYPDLRKPISFYCDADMECVEPMTALMAGGKVFERAPNGAPKFNNSFAYHFENEKFVSFLETFATNLGINIVEDKVEQVLVNQSGVTGLSMASGRTETADLFVDCSGFVSLLLGKTLQEPFINFKGSLFCDRAVVGGWTRKPGEPIYPYTTCSTMDSGWLWQIEHEHRINRGYVYCSSFISDEQAEREFRSKSPDVTQTRVVKFVSGRYERNFVKNVVAIGNASGFVEPLEATALGVIATQSRVLADSLATADRQIRPTHARYINYHHSAIWDATRAFIAIHYKYNTRIDTPFWQECREKTDLAGADDMMEYYRENGPCSFWGPLVVGHEDPFGINGYITLLLGQRVGHRINFTPTDQEMQKVSAIRQHYRQMAQQGLTAEQVLAAIRDPQWKWQ